MRPQQHEEQCGKGGVEAPHRGISDEVAAGDGSESGRGHVRGEQHEPGADQALAAETAVAQVCHGPRLVHGELGEQKTLPPLAPERRQKA